MQTTETVKKKTASLAQNEKGERVIKITFPYDLETLFNVRNLPGRKWHPEHKCWSAPINIDSLERLIGWGFDLDPRLHKFLEQSNTQTKEITINGVPGLKGTLFPFQGEGISFIERNGGRALIADEMGLGKTVQALGWLQMHPNLRPVIVVVPASLKLNWKKEAERWMTNPKVEVLSGGSPWNITGQIIVINYDILHNWISTLRAINPKVLITDECHYYKSNSAKRTKAVKMLSKGIPHVIALSGTPIINRPVEAYNAIKIIDPNLFPDYWHYVKHYCNARNNGFGWDFSGATHTDELHRILKRTIMIRRLKKDVLKDLPDKIYSFVPMELENEEEYKKAESNFIRFIHETKGKEAAIKASNAEAFAKIETLKQLSVKGKLPQAVDWIRDFLDVDGKLVVFATHTFVIDYLMKTFGNMAVKIDGSTPMNQRQAVVEAFQNNSKVRLFVGNIKAAGVGITLTASSNVAFLELPWTPGELVQAEDRCHRIGQKDSVNIHYLLATDTIEEKISKLIDSKRKVLDAVLDGKETEQESLLSELIKQYQYAEY